jgi:hypothetical protein
MRGGGFGERELPCDNRSGETFREPGIQVGINFGQLIRLRGKEHYTPHVSFSQHEVARIDLHRPATSNDHDSPAQREHREVMAKVYVGEHFDDQVNSFSTGRRANQFEVPDFVVVEDFIRAIFREQHPPRLRSTSRENAQTCGYRQLYSGDADATGSAVDKHRFAMPRAAPAKQRPVGSCVRDPNRSALGKRQRIGQRLDLLRRAETEFRVRSGQRSGYIYAFRGSKSPDAIAKSFDRSCPVIPRGVG